MIQSNFKG